VIRLDVGLVDGEAHLHARDLGMLGDERAPDRGDRRARAGVALDGVAELLAEHREEP
jgi:hypothetical protein